MPKPKSKEKLKPVLINLPEDLITKLHKVAGKKTYQTGRRIYLANVVREAITKYLNSQ